MKLAHVHIKNFKSIGDIEFMCAGLTVFVGRNSVGKSNVLRALDVFFSTSDKILTEDMFCSFLKHEPEIIIELTFKELTEEERAGRLQKYVCQSLGPGMRVRKVIRWQNEKLKSLYHGWVEEPTTEWLQSEFRGYGTQSFWHERDVDFFAYTSASGGRITRDLFEEFRTNYIMRHREELSFELRLSATEFEGLKTVGRDMLPQFTLIPAVGDVADIVVGRRTSLLNRIVSQILRSIAGEVEALKKAQHGLEVASGLVNRDGLIPRLPQVKAIEEWFCQEFSDWGKIDLKIGTVLPDIDDLLTQNLSVTVYDGSEGDIGTKGHGLQRQLIYRAIRLNAALIKGEVDWAGAEGTLPEFPPIILAFEEPELYLHPQAQLAFYDDIKKLSGHDQVLLCTHSTHLVDIEDFEGIKILRRSSLTTATVKCECSSDLFDDLSLKSHLALAKLFDANVNKAFFADKIVIVEGDEDVIAITKTARDHVHCFTYRVTIINAGGKDNIPHLQRVLNGFQIPYTVVYDVDPGNEASERTTAKIETLVAELAPFGLCASMPMDPDLPTVVGYGETRLQKAVGCIRYLDSAAPREEFRDKVKTIYELPNAGILTPA